MTVTYQPFVIVSYLRSGTHLLRTSLESHPSIVCQTEVFNSDNPNLPYPLSLPTQQVLDQWVYNDIAVDISHVGFVLQAYHPHSLRAFPGIRANENWENIWDILANTANLKVIHLRRKNLLKRHLSHLKARASGQWHNWNAMQLGNVSLLEKPDDSHIDQYKKSSDSFHIDENLLKQDFQEVEYWHNKAQDFFKPQQCLSLNYEDLAQDLSNQSSKLLDFLGASPLNLNSAVRKLEKRSLAESITNYYELKKTFATTRWHVFFEE